MKLDNETFSRHNLTDGNFYTPKYVIKFFFQYGIYSLTLHGMLGNALFLAYMVSRERRNSQFLFILLRLISVTNFCVNLCDFALSVFKEFLMTFQFSLLILLLELCLDHFMEALLNTLKLFNVLLIVAMSLERYMILDCFHWHKKYFVAGNMKYLMTIIITITTTIMFPVYYNYFHVWADFIHVKSNITHLEDIYFRYKLYYRLDNGPGPFYIIYQNIFFNIILFFVMVIV
ncbi:unnamed protein product [Gordionus sp. m RMFG-2023]